MNVDGKPEHVLPKEWDAIRLSLEALGARLHGEYDNENEGYEAWLQELVAKLPAGVFVWLDEFEREYFANLPSRVENRPVDDELNYCPLLSDEVGAIVREGFSPNEIVSLDRKPLSKHDANPSPSESYADRAWLYAGGITWVDVEYDNRHAGQQNKPPSRQVFQEEEILRALDKLKYNPKKLPKNVPGKHGVKAEVRKHLSYHDWTITVFDKAWERLRAQRRIMNLHE